MSVTLAPPPPPPAPVPAGWEGILAQGERLLWQGNPSGQVRFGAREIGMSVFGVFFAGFALFWMIMAAQAGGLFWMFGLLHFAVGIGMIIGGPFGGAYVRRHSTYSLSTKRAFIAQDLPLVGRKLDSYPILPDTPLKMVDWSDDMSSIYFADRKRRNRNGSSVQPIGFDMIVEGRHVMALMRQIQAGTI